MKALVLSGGGAKGAFSVGVIKKLIEKGETFDMISGTSTGALIAPLVATGEIDMLEKIYTTVKDKDILDKYDDSNLLKRILFSKSLYGIHPLVKLVEYVITQERYEKMMASGKKIYLASVCLQTQRITCWTNDKNAELNSKYYVFNWLNREQFIRCVLASSVQPVLMPPITINGLDFVDGGVKEFFPVDIVIDNGADKITGILTTTGTNYYDQQTFDSFKSILLKTIEILTGDVSYNDLRLAQLYNQGISYIAHTKNKIQQVTGLNDEAIDDLFTSVINPFFGKRKLDLQIIRPLRELGDGLTFVPEEMKLMFEEGYKAV